MLSLGYEVLQWMLDNLAAPDRSEYEPFVPTDEQARFILRFYEVDVTGRQRLRRRGVYSRSKGYGKSPKFAAIACAEALGPVVPDGLDAYGNPVGRPWSSLRTPWVQLAATSEDQTKNSWLPLLEMLREGPAVDEYPGLEPLDTFVNLPKGRIEPVTAAASSREGNRPVFVGMDQTESWTASNGGQRLAATLRRNLAKTGGASLEAPNAFKPGEQSVAEQTYEAAKLDKSILYDEQQGFDVKDLTDRKAVIASLRKAYGSHALPTGWVDLERLAAEIADPATDPDDARQFFFNLPVVPKTAWMAPEDWKKNADASVVIPDREVVAAGFDGSINSDSTALVIATMSGHVELFAMWEKDGTDPEWEVPRREVSEAVATMFSRYNVVKMFADPGADWATLIGEWMTAHGEILDRDRKPQKRVQEFDTRHFTRMTRALDRLREDARAGRLTHDGDSRLAQHVANARVRKRGDLYTIAKEKEQSPKKIDAAMAATLAWAARSQAFEDGLDRPRQRRTVAVAY
jgi:hypothetical protein